MNRKAVLMVLIILTIFALPALVLADDSLEQKGVIDSMPPGGGAGIWLVGGLTFEATAATEIDVEKGPLAVGVCAEVEYDLVGGQNIAKKIASKSADNCSAENGFEHEGFVQDMPIGGGPGTWVIGGVIFEASVTTEFRTDAGPLATGVCADVDFFVQGTDNVAIRIRSRELTDCQGDDDEEVHGIVDTMPAGLIGTWTVNGVNYEATTTTEFEQSDGPFGEGVCVEIEFFVQNGQKIALEIKTDDDCDAGTLLQPIQHASGILEAFPATMTGTWTVDGLDYEASAETRFETEHGDFALGICVQIDYVLDGAIRTALEIETESSDDCDGPQHEAQAEVIGLLEAMPAMSGTVSFSGTWTIDGVNYEANLQTRFDQEYGPFEIGRCVEVKYYLDGGTPVATRIKTKHRHDCSEDNEDNEVFGTVEALPDNGLMGLWTVGGLQYQVTATTLLDDGPFFVGLLVEIHFTVAADGTLMATRIEGKQAVGNDDRALAVSYGPIEVMPSGGLSGSWTIGGVDYLATNSTKFEEDEGPFTVGACAKVRYRLQDGTNVAAKIETEPAGDCQDDNSLPQNRLYGFVDQLPANGYIGTWIIGGLNFEVLASTELKEDHGAFVKGAFVKVKFVLQGGIRAVQEIETHVPPGAGTIIDAGPLQMDNQLRQATASTPQIWHIGGQAYTIVDTTLLDDDRADFVNGQPVLVNAYSQNGSRVATKVTALGSGNITYLPVVVR